MHFNRIVRKRSDTELKINRRLQEEIMYIRQGFPQRADMAMQQTRRFNNPSMQFLFSVFVLRYYLVLLFHNHDRRYEKKSRF
jgi:hypothetical protein